MEDEWFKVLSDERTVKFTYQGLTEDRAFITAQIGGNEVVYSVVLTKVMKALNHEEVESHFEHELCKN
jgi:hypothetical protein